MLKQILLEDKNLLDRCYDAKKILRPMSLKCIKIHACSNDCILYMKESKNLDKCLEYGESDYKLKDDNGDDNDNDNVSKKLPHARMLWYLPIISRFKRLLLMRMKKKNITWHTNERKYDGNICHVVDSLQWKKIVFFVSGFWP